MATNHETYGKVDEFVIWVDGCEYDKELELGEHIKSAKTWEVW